MKLRQAFAEGRDLDGSLPSAEQRYCETCQKPTDEVTMAHLECASCSAKRARKRRRT